MRKIPLRVIIPIAIAVAIIIACVIYLNHDFSINSGEFDVLYNDIVYVRAEPSYNLKISEENAKYSGGDYAEVYAYGQEVLWEIYVLNEDENLLYSSIYVWAKPGYEVPQDFGEEFSSVNYVVSEGADFLIMPDVYVETVNERLADFESGITLEDIVFEEATEVESFTYHGSIRFDLTNHKDLSLYYDLCKAGDKYYLNVMQNPDGADALYEIRPEYVELLTSLISEAE